MGFLSGSGTILIDATLTDVGRRKLAHGNFRVSKFSLGDDEIDYGLFKAASRDDDTYFAEEILNLPIFEAFPNEMKNIQYGLLSFTKPDLFYLPVLKENTKIKITPSRRDGTYYLSVNKETTDKVNEIFSNSFKFLKSGDTIQNKLIIESGLDTIPETGATSDGVNYSSRNRYILKNNLLDKHFLIAADSRLIYRAYGVTQDSSFKNFPDGGSDIKFVSSKAIAPTSYLNQFDKYTTYIIETIPNLISNFTGTPETFTAATGDDSFSSHFSALVGPKGSVAALSFEVDSDLKDTSTTSRNYKFEKFGEIDKTLFDSTNKFDYIDTTIYVTGVTSNARLVVPLRLLRYAGT